MVLTNIDSIVRRWLLEEGYPIHWYAEGLFHASAGLRELSFDSLQIVNSRQLPVNDYFAIDLPEDFVDDVMLGIPVGGEIQAVPKNYSLNPLRATTSDGDYTQYNTATTINSVATAYLPYALWYYNFNDYGEPTGRYFGARGGAIQNGYKVIKERRQIQVTESFTATDAILMYISDGQSLDAASQIDTRAFEAIKSYIAWKCSSNKNNNFSPEGQNWHNQRRLLRARMNDFTVTDIRNIILRAYTATVKN